MLQLAAVSVATGVATVYQHAFCCMLRCRHELAVPDLCQRSAWSMFLVLFLTRAGITFATVHPQVFGWKASVPQWHHADCLMAFKCQYIWRQSSSTLDRSAQLLSTPEDRNDGHVADYMTLSASGDSWAPYGWASWLLFAWNTCTSSTLLIFSTIFLLTSEYAHFEGANQLAKNERPA